MTATIPEDYYVGEGETMFDVENYDTEPDVYKKIYNVSTDLNIILEFLTVFINIIHFFILTRKELRSISIYIIMIAICINDTIFFSLDCYATLIERELITNIFPIPYEECLRSDYSEISIGYAILVILKEFSRRVSIWLAMLMAFLRMVSVMFPMNKWAQKVTKPKSAVILTLIVFLVFFTFAAWPCVVFMRVFWLPDNLNKMCQYHPKSSTQARYLFAFPNDVGLTFNNLSFLEGIMKSIPAVVYPILTVMLVIQLRNIKKQRRSMNKNDCDKPDNTTKLILFMTVAFMLSEGLAGIWDFFQYFQYSLFEWNETFMYWILTLQYPVNNLKTLNALSHFFVCYLMSSQYRDVVKSWFCRCGGPVKKRRKVIMVEERTQSIASRSSMTESRSRKF